MRLMRHLRRPVWVVVTVGMLLIPALPGGAAPGAGRASPVVGSDTRFSGPAATSYEERSDVAWSSSAGQYLVVWSDGRADATRGEDIYARLVGADGKPIGGERMISGPTALGDDRCPAVAWGATTQQYLVIWQDGRNASWDIYGRRVAADGKPVGDDFKISASNADEFCGDVAWGSSTNQFLVVWEDYRSYGRGADIFGRMVGADGKPVGTTDTMISGTGATSDDYAPAVAWGATTRQYLVVWSDYRNDASRGADIYGRRVTAAGAPTGGDFCVGNGPWATANDKAPAIAWSSAANQFLVVWEDWRRPANRGIEIYGQRVKANGTLAGGEKLISGAGATADEGTPGVAWSATSRQFLVVWQDWRNYWVSPVRYADTFGRKMADTGSLVGGDFRICGPKALMNEYDPAVAWDATLHQFLVVWTDARSYYSTPPRLFDIYGRLVTG